MEVEKLDQQISVKKDEKKHTDLMTEIIGEYKIWQFVWTFFPCITVATHAWMMMSNKWVTYNVDHWCERPDTLMDMNVSAWQNLSTPVDEEGDFDNCYIFDIDYQTVTERPPDDTPVKDCLAWEYDHSLFQDTATERWNLVCNRKHFRRVIQMMFFAGNFTGVLVSGFIADRLGRKFCFLLFLTCWILFGVSGPFIPYLPLWIIIRFFCGAFSLGYNNCIAVYGVELTHGKWRAIIGNLIGESFWNIGVLTLAGLTYGCRNMKTLELVIGLSNVPFLLLWCIMPESPRWLLATGRKEEAYKVLHQAAEWNKRDPTDVKAFVDNFDDEKIVGGHFLDLFKHPAIRRNSLLMCFSWLSFSMGYFGLMYNTPSLDWSVFLVYAIPPLLSLALCYVDPFLENYLGRKFMLTVPLLCAGVLLVTLTCVPKDSFVIIILAWAGIICCGLSFGDGYTFTKELYPTVLRTQALSAASAAARIGSIISPFIAMLDEFHDLLPIVVYGVIIFAAGTLSIWIWPETKGRRLPDSLEDSIVQASGPNTWVACCACSRSTGRNEIKPV